MKIEKLLLIYILSWQAAIIKYKTFLHFKILYFMKQTFSDYYCRI